MKNKIALLAAVIVALSLASCVVPGGGGREEASYLIRATKAAGQYEGPAEIWSAPGKRLATGRFRAGQPTGTWTFWDSHGTKTVMLEYLNGRQSGSIEMYYGSSSFPGSAGKLKLRGSLQNGLWNGPVTTYSPAGKKLSERRYQGGILVSCHGFDPNGGALNDRQAMEQAEHQSRADRDYFATLDEIIRNSALYAKPIP